MLFPRSRIRVIARPPVPPAETSASLRPGMSVQVRSSAGSRLAAREGVVVGFAATRSQVRVLLRGAKGRITLNARYLEVHDSP